MHNIPLKGQEENLSRRSIGAGIEEIWSVASTVPERTEHHPSSSSCATPTVLRPRISVRTNDDDPYGSPAFNITVREYEAGVSPIVNVVPSKKK
jgi:hypothetical protein